VDRLEREYRFLVSPDPDKLGDRLAEMISVVSNRARPTEPPPTEKMRFRSSWLRSKCTDLEPGSRPIKPKARLRLPIIPDKRDQGANLPQSGPGERKLFRVLIAVMGFLREIATVLIGM